ncbi:zinc-ribbon domain-containing protein [Paracoccus aerius]
MAEIRLICPGCAAEYRVPGSAVPAGGREVECSACGHVWHATPTPEADRLDLAAFQALPAAEPAADLPRPARKLPENVLDILRDEVEHERRARAAEEDQPDADPAAKADPAPDAPGPDVAPDPASRPAPDPEWPATTITRHFDARPAAAQKTDPESAPRPARHPVPLKAEVAVAPGRPRRNDARNRWRDRSRRGRSGRRKAVMSWASRLPSWFWQGFLRPIFLRPGSRTRAASARRLVACVPASTGHGFGCRTACRGCCADQKRSSNRPR